MAWQERARDLDHLEVVPLTRGQLCRVTWLALVLTVIGIPTVTVSPMAATAGGMGGATPDAEASSAPRSGGRVESSERGFAITVPDGWIAIELAGDEGAPGLGDLDDAAVVAGATTVLAALERRADVQVVVLDPSARAGCGFAVTRETEFGLGLFAPLDLDQFAGVVYLSMAGADDIGWVERPTAVALPAGQSRVIRFADATGMEGAVYVGKVEAMFMALCVSEERPTDDWRSVAETLEILPEPV